MAAAIPFIGALTGAASLATSVQASRSQKKVMETQAEEARNREKAAAQAEKEGRINMARAADVVRRGAARRKSAGAQAVSSQRLGGNGSYNQASTGAKTLLGQ